MKVCNEVKRLIDEADRPDVLGFQVANHLSLCAGCKSFANERASLRKLLASGERVSAPNNFDAMLTARMKARSERALSWFNLSPLMRVGAAIAAVAVMAFVAQYSGLFSNNDRVAQPEPSIARAPDAAEVNQPKPPALALPDTKGDVNKLAQFKPEHSHTAAAVTVRVPQRYYARRGGEMANNRVRPQDYSSLDGGVVLVRGPNGEQEVPMPTVSVGAQPLFYSRQAQPVRNVATSF